MAMVPSRSLASRIPSSTDWCGSSSTVTSSHHGSGRVWVEKRCSLSVYSGMGAQ